MSEEELLQLVQDFGFDETSPAHRLAVEVERQTRHAYFGIIQSVNNGASQRSFTRRQLDKFAWDCEHKEESA